MNEETSRKGKKRRERERGAIAQTNNKTNCEECECMNDDVAHKSKPEMERGEEKREERERTGIRRESCVRVGHVNQKRRNEREKREWNREELVVQSVSEFVHWRRLVTGGREREEREEKRREEKQKVDNKGHLRRAGRLVCWKGGRGEAIN